MAANLAEHEVSSGTQDPAANSSGLPTSGRPAARGPRWTVVVAVSLIAIGVTGYMVWDAMAKEDTPAVKKELMCSVAECGFSEARPVRLGETFPVKCPKCGQASMYVSMACPNCKTPNVLLQDQGLPGPTKCSRCGTELRYGE